MQPQETPGEGATQGTKTRGAGESVNQQRMRRRAPFTLVENTTARPFGLSTSAPVVPGEKPGEAEVRGVVPIDWDQCITLKPGINRVDTEKWEAAKKQKMVAKHMKGDKKGGPAFVEHTDVENLADLPENDALRLIPKTFDRELLGDWLETDNRESVHDALTMQIDLYEKTLKGRRTDQLTV